MKIVKEAGGSVSLHLETKEEVDLLSQMIAFDVIGAPGEDMGITGGLNAGLEYSDEYWGTKKSMIEALTFARDLLVGLGFESSSVTLANEFIERSGHQGHLIEGRRYE